MTQSLHQQTEQFGLNPLNLPICKRKLLILKFQRSLDQLVHAVSNSLLLKNSKLKTDQKLSPNMHENRQRESLSGHQSLVSGKP